MAQMIQLNTVMQLFTEKGIIAEQAFFSNLKQVRLEYEIRESKG